MHVDASSSFLKFLKQDHLYGSPVLLFPQFLLSISLFFLFLFDILLSMYNCAEGSTLSGQEHCASE